MKDFYNEKYSALKKEIENHTRKTQNISQSWVSRTNTVKMTIFPKLPCRFNEIPIKITTAFLTKLEKAMLKLI